MTYHVIVKNRALRDIERNLQWWAEHHSSQQALRWHETTFAAIYKLDTFPDSHPIADESDAFAYEIRELHFGTGSRGSPRFPMGSILASSVFRQRNIQAFAVNCSTRKEFILTLSKDR